MSRRAPRGAPDGPARHPRETAASVAARVSFSRRSVARLAAVAEEELLRAMRTMRIPGHPRPFYMSYLVREEEHWRVAAKYGSLKVQVHDRNRNAFVDVRVGSPRSDQLREGGLEDNDKESESYGYVELPFGGGFDGVRHGLWRLADARYREAVAALLHKRSHQLTYVDTERGRRGFERRERVVDQAWTELPAVDEAYWVEYVERASALLKSFPQVQDSSVEFNAEHTCKIFVNSEGSRVIHCPRVWSLECYVWMLSPEGHGLPWTVRHMVTDPAELPGRAAFERAIRSAVERLRRFVRAPLLRSFSGPALLEPVPAGLLMHEAVGHRLEGSRLLSSGEGQTFAESVGQRILPEFLSLRDDPTLATFGGRSLVGHYRYDDEGVPARDTLLVDRGRLTGFLTTRTGSRRRSGSTGHARSDYHQRPTSRMSNLIVEARGGLDDRGLKRKLVEEVRRQGAPFGVRIVDATCGETSTDAYDFQAFLGEATQVTRVWPDGREQWLRGVNFVGTPLNAIRNIVAAGNRLEVDNSWCGAESGDVPVSTISPGIVVSELELQSKPDSPLTQFSFPIPWRRRKSPRR